jgi:hypothetical protein
VDDEPIPPTIRLDQSPVYVTEGNAGSTEAAFTVRLSHSFDAPVTVTYSTAEGDTEWWDNGYYDPPPAATSGVDFAATTGTITFAPGETEKRITIAVLGDRIPEQPWVGEHFSVTLSNPQNGNLDAESDQAVGIILDDEPQISIGNATVTEGNSGTKTLSFTVSLNAPHDQVLNVSYATSNQSALAGSDYQAKSGTITFAPGETSKTITVPIKGDRVGEDDEQFAVNLTSAPGAHLLGQTGYGWIVDNEPRVDIWGEAKIEGKKGKTTLMTFTVILDQAYDQAVTMSYRTVDGDAKAGSDYKAKTGTLTFAPGQTTKTITVEIIGDNKREYDEYFGIELFNLSSNAYFWNDTGYGTILNDDLFW